MPRKTTSSLLFAAGLTTGVLLGNLVPSSARAQTTFTGNLFDEFFTDNLSMPGNNVAGNNPAIPAAGPPTGFVQWTISGGSIDLVGGINPAGLQPDTGGRFVDLGGSTGDPGLFATNPTFTFLAGMTYNLSFLYNSTGTFLTPGAPTTETAAVNIGSLSFGNVSTSSGAFLQFSQDFSFPSGATGAALTFQDLGTDNSGLGIDRVMVMPVVPEPGSLALLAVGAGLGGMALVRRRVRRG